MTTNPTETRLDETCTCGNFSERHNHENHCDLWWDDDFEDGFAFWNPELQKLDYYSDSEWEARQQELLEDELYDGYGGYGNVLFDDADIADGVIIQGENKNKGKLSTTSAAATTYYYKCRHYQQPVTLPNGSTIYCSSEHSNRANDPIPNLGIYASGMWTPDCVAFYIGWPDYGVPKPDMESVLHMLREGIRLADDGQRVEIGCMGGHGRTGTMLAIMVLLTMDEPNAQDAIKWVHGRYCKEAIEGAKQEWYIACVAAELNGAEWPEKPPEPKPRKYVKFDDGTYGWIDIDDAPVTNEAASPLQNNTVWYDSLLGKKKQAPTEVGEADVAELQSAVDSAIEEAVQENKRGNQRGNNKKKGKK